MMMKGSEKYAAQSRKVTRKIVPNILIIVAYFDVGLKSGAQKN
jgi:hypothetical protein